MGELKEKGLRVNDKAGSMRATHQCPRPNPYFPAGLAPRLAPTSAPCKAYSHPIPK